MADKGEYELIGRAINDSDFRARLLKDPSGIISEEGYQVSKDFIAKIEAIDIETVEAVISDLEDKFDLKAAM